MSNPIPWWAPGAADRMLELCEHRISALEWGSGKSTAWLARHFSAVVSVEHDMAWGHATLSDLAIEHPASPVSLLVIEPGSLSAVGASSKIHFGFGGLELTAYVTAPPVRPYSLVCVDGRARVACLNHVLDAGLVGARGGVLVLDNSERPRYREAVRRVDDTGWAREDFEDKWRTTLWVRPA